MYWNKVEMLYSFSCDDEKSRQWKMMRKEEVKTVIKYGMWQSVRSRRELALGESAMHDHRDRERIKRKV